MHVRPVLPDHQRCPDTVLARNGGPYELGAVVDLGRVRPRARPPEIEDVILAGRPAHVGDFAPGDFWALIDDAAQDELEDIFGASFGRRGSQACGTPEGYGDASLGVLRPARPMTLHWDEWKGQARIKASVPFGRDQTRVPVTDVRLYEADCVTPSYERFDLMSRMIRSGRPVLVAVGLSRPYAPDGGEASHWLQVNGIYVGDGDLWRDGDGRD
ncbi:MAG: hypothetical protein L6413_09455 [Coriobacteriia bacterium]|nr:hypothetical protein [Coriobacteriia bacterium]